MSKTITKKRLSELIVECDRAAADLATKGDKSEAIGLFVSREVHRARARKFADTANALRELEKRRLTRRAATK